MPIERIIDVSDTSITINQLFLSDVNGVVWDSALVAIHFLSKNPHLVKGKKILDLGSGTGAASIVCGVVGGDVIATDLPDRLDLITDNIQLNRDKIEGHVVVEELDWNNGFNKDVSIDLLLVIDCVYYKQSIDALINTIKDVNAKKTLLAYEIRDIGETIEAQEMFMRRVKEEFTIEEVTNEDLDEFACDEITLAFLIPK